MKTTRNNKKFGNETRGDVAELFGVSTRTIDRWVQGGMPKKSNGRYDLGAVVAWKLDQLAMETAPAERDAPQLERWRRIRADLAALELAHRKEQLVEVDDVLAAWCHRHSMVRDALLSLVDRLPPMVVGLEQLEIREQIEAETDHILECFATEGKFTPKVKEG